MNNTPRNKQFNNFLATAQRGKKKSKEETKKSPEKKKEVKESMNKKEKLVSFINNLCNKNYTDANSNLQDIVDLTMKEKMSAEMLKQQNA